jgi:DNA (cytosine-5)-methyltransferase 1
LARPRLLDLFCGAGGAAMGYSRAGFDVVGVDIAPQPRFPFAFVQANAMTYPLEGFDAIHASPPCQRYSTMTRGLWKDREHPDLIAATRERIRAAGVPYVIENVENARRLLIEPVKLCGTMFGLGTKEGNQLRRHRYFECSFGYLMTPPCQHNAYSAVPVYGGGQDGDYHTPRRKPKTIGVWGHAGGSSARDGLVQFNTAARREAMGIDWMTGDELSESIPPAYTEFIGAALIRNI